MSGSIIGGVIGAVVGTIIAPGTGTIAGWEAGIGAGTAIGFAVGSVAGGLLFPPSTTAPGLEDLRPQSSSYGTPIPIIYGTFAVGGTVIWAADLIQTSDGGGGGKGGGSAPGGKTYAANFAVMLCESLGSVQLGKIWAGPEKRLVYDPTGALMESGTVTFYDGSLDQGIDPLMEAALGVGNVPAYTGRAYIVIEGFDVTKHDGNRIPFLTVEVGQKGSTAPESLGTVWFNKMWYSASLDSLISSYHGSYYGFLQNSGTTMLCESNVNTGRYAVISLLFWDDARQKVVSASNGGSFSNQYYTTAFPTGSDTAHNPMTIASGSASIGACMASNLYCFAFNCGATDGYGYKFQMVNPDTNLVSAVYHVDAGDTDAIVKVIGAADDASFCWAFMASGDVCRFDLNGTLTRTVVGTKPTGYAPQSWDNSAMFNHVDGRLYAVRHVYSVGASMAYLAAYSSTTEIFNTSGSVPFFDINSTPWYFSPDGMIYLTGSIWLAVDGRAIVDPSSGAVSGDSIKRLDAADPCTTALYVGTTDAQGWVYLPTMGRVVATRYGGAWAGSDPLARSILNCANAADGYLGKRDSSFKSQTLAEVVTDLSLRAGLPEADIDVTELTDTVDGYSLSAQVTVKDAIAVLMPVYYFEAVEDQGAVRFIKRGGGLAAAIPDADLGASEAASISDAPDLYMTTRTMDEELPRTMTITYLLRASKYSLATKYARRLTGSSGSEQTNQLAMVLTDQKAAEVAQVNLYDRWVGRVGFNFSLSREYAYLMPTDIVGIGGYSMRVVSATYRANGVTDYVAVRDESDTYTPSVVVDETPPVVESVSIAGSTTLAML